MSHRIRLRRPWTRITEIQTGVTRTEDRVDVPDAPESDGIPAGDPADDAATAVRYSRRFNCPSGLSADDRVFIQIGGWTGRLTDVSCNAHSQSILPSSPDVSQDCRVDVTDVIQPSNELQIRLSSTGTCVTPRLVGEVCVWIERLD